MDFDAGYSDSYQPQIGYGASSVPHPDAGSEQQGSQRNKASQPLYKASSHDYDDDRDRRDRSYDDRDRDSRRDSRRDRDRSRSRSGRRDSRRDYDRDSRRDSRRDRDYDRDRDRDRDRHRDREPPLSHMVHIKGLAMLSGEDSVRETLKSVEMYVGAPRDVRMIAASKDNKDPRPAAAIEMPSADAARMLISYGSLVVDGVTASLEAAKRPPSKDDLRRDWICKKCGGMNFSRRMECFQCGVPREGNAQPVDESAPRQAAAGLNNENVVIVRDLSEYVEEESLRNTFVYFGQVREVRLVRDKYTNVGKGFAFIEFERHNDAMNAIEEANTNGVYVDGRRVNCGIARGKDAPASSHKNVASAAIEAAMALNASRMGGKASGGMKGKTYEEEYPPAAAAAAATAPAEGFEMDPSTGFFYNETTQQYFDGITGMYYTFKDGQCYYFDMSKQEYSPCQGLGNPTAPRVG